MRELLILDGTALLFRAFFGMKHEFPGPGGIDVGGVWGALQVVHKQMRRRRPTHVAVVFDAGQKTFRNELDPNYKANRGAPPPELVPQFDLLRDACGALGLATFMVPGFEADDLMATLATLAGRFGAATRLLAVDKDLCQLVRDDEPPIVVEDPYTGRVYDARAVAERMGVPPERVVPFLALVGDSSDNVPGVRGVGPKAAAALLERWATLDELYRSLDQVELLPVRGARTLGRKLLAGHDDARRARSLVALRHDVELQIGAGALAGTTCWSGVPDGADGFFDERLGFRAPVVGLRQVAGQDRVAVG